jgi:hypothetical protein
MDTQDLTPPEQDSRGKTRLITPQLSSRNSAVNSPGIQSRNNPFVCTIQLDMSLHSTYPPKSESHTNCLKSLIGV